MGWNADGYRKFSRSFVLIRGVTYLMTGVSRIEPCRHADQQHGSRPLRRGVGTAVKLVPTVLLEFLLHLGPKPL